ncbi:MAG: TIGR04211 family SH3 domain-containing protein, partial [Gammaproteobacteria bacterium]|nr:TIGR04211 family SH3 domain-containing protein [Gammaproteobacteria bacterium]
MKRNIICIASLFFLLVSPVWASKYVSDVLWVTLRAEASDNSESVKVLKSGTSMEALEEQEIDGYLHVKTENGDEGWIKSRYLDDQPIAALRVAGLEQQLEKITKENESLKSKLSSELKDGKEADRERKRTISENQKLKQENAELKKLAEKPLQLQQENEKLK